MPKVNHTLTQARLKELFDYDPETGAFTWKIMHGGRRRIPAGRKAGTIAVDGAVVIRFDGKSHRAHRLAWLYVHGYLPKEIDHINCCPADNMIENLRECTHVQNAHNVRPTRRNQSGFKGVCWHKRKHRWTVSIMNNGKSHFLGYFDILADAANAYRLAAKRLHGEFARLK